MHAIYAALNNKQSLCQKKTSLARSLLFCLLFASFAGFEPATFERLRRRKVEPDYFQAATAKISIESLVAGAGFEPATFGL